MPGSLLSPDPFAALVIFPFGLIVGSFANVVIHRLPLGTSVVFPPSRCPGCGAFVRPWQNIPVISWILLKGRCASCGEPISLRYPAVELIHAAGFALIVLKFGIRPFTPLLLLFFFALVVLAFIDWEHQILPDVITLPGILVGVLGAFVPGALVGWREAALAAAFGYVAFFLVAEGYSRLRGIEGLGQGDWKLAAMMGAFLGGQPLMLTVFLGSLSGLAYGLIQAARKRGQRGETEAKALPLSADGIPDTAAPASEPAAPEAHGPEPAAEDAPVDVPGTVPAAGGELAPAGAPEDGKTEELESIGKYKLPFGTFLAASAIFVLFFGDAVLAWYASLFRF